MELLKFGIGNAKLGKKIHTFSLPAGHSCPGASACLAKADRMTGKITDGVKQQFRCFAASMEWRSSVRESRWHNFEALKGLGRVDTYNTITASLPREAKVVRVHVSGDFFSESYFLAWLDVARSNPDMTFYAYTKSINWWVRHRDEVPANFKLTASYGGRFDALIEEFELKTAKVVFSIEEAAALGLAIDHDDSHAYGSEASFALLIHGGQKAGSVAGQAVRALGGIGSYSKRTRMRPAALDYVSGSQTAEQSQNAV